MLVRLFRQNNSVLFAREVGERISETFREVSLMIFTSSVSSYRLTSAPRKELTRIERR
jgi:hypothetical protein